MSGTKVYNIVGAFDRHNYGDILFPLIHAQFIQRKVDKADIRFFSITASDMSVCGGVRSEPIKKLIAHDGYLDSTTIMSGGDLLGADWVTMKGHVSSEAFFILLKATKKILGFTLANRLVARVFGELNEFPYVLSGKSLSGKVFYVCVGGSGFRSKDDKYHLSRVADELKTVARVSVRDQNTYELLRDKGVDCELIPDSALVMSDYYPLNVLNSRNWRDSLLQDNGFDIGNFFVFQSGEYFISKCMDEVKRELDTVSKKTGMSILFLPIGRATGHDDHKVLYPLYMELKKSGLPVAFQNSPHVLDIMAGLANGKFYVGTSLHGAISAYSFGNKVCGFSLNNVPKLKSFVLSWMESGDYCLVDNNYFSPQVLGMIKDGAGVLGVDGLQRQKAMVYSELQRYL
ncbi:polysaccharide pyruvyl transferase family protein [Zestomonas carbonaria]|nr:polysaccharide pyruvyl transferase family protein [Pseudomonas carbonaria]